MPETRLMTDDRNQLAAILAEQGQHRQRGLSRRELGSFLGLRPAGNVRQNLRSLLGANQGTRQKTIGCLAELFQSGRGLPSPPYPRRRQGPRVIVAPTMVIALKCNRMSDDQQLHRITARSREPSVRHLQPTPRTSSAAFSIFLELL